MIDEEISAADETPRRRVRVRDAEMAYVDIGARDPCVFLTAIRRVPISGSRSFALRIRSTLHCAGSNRNGRFEAVAEALLWSV